MHEAALAAPGDDLDDPSVRAMSDAVSALALSAYFFGDSTHGHRAAKLLSTWFLDDATRMNPNAEYAQGIPGKCTGRDMPCEG